MTEKEFRATAEAIRKKSYREKEFNLSEEFEELKNRFDKKTDTTKLWVIEEVEGKIKEAIRLEKNLLLEVRDGKISWFKFFEKRNKIFGDKLI